VRAVRAIGCIVDSLPHNESNFPQRGTDFYITKPRSIDRETRSISSRAQGTIVVNIVTLGWAYVVLMAALVEATGPNGSILGAIVTVLLYGALPIAVLSYISGAGRRRRAARAAASTPAAAGAASAPQAAGALAGERVGAGSDGVDPGGGGQAPGEALATVREKA
jgi:hypothetical protein